MVSKLSSRKLWIGVALVVIGIVLCIIGDVENGMRIIAIGGIGYLGAEAIVDIARAIWPSTSSTDSIEESTETTDDSAE